MKKLLAIASIVFLASCANQEKTEAKVEEAAAKVDSVATAVVDSAANTAAAVVDSAANKAGAVVDSAKAAVKEAVKK